MEATPTRRGDEDHQLTSSNFLLINNSPPPQDFSYSQLGDFGAMPFYGQAPWFLSTPVAGDHYSTPFPRVMGMYPLDNTAYLTPVPYLNMYDTSCNNLTNVPGILWPPAPPGPTPSRDFSTEPMTYIHEPTNQSNYLSKDADAIAMATLWGSSSSSGSRSYQQEPMPWTDMSTLANTAQSPGGSTVLSQSTSNDNAATLHCRYCSRDTITKNDTKKAGDRQPTKLFSCPIASCSESSGYKKSIERHLWISHTDYAEKNDIPGKPIKCPIRGCKKKKKSRPDNMERHLRRVHGVYQNRRGKRGVN